MSINTYRENQRNINPYQRNKFIQISTINKFNERNKINSNQKFIKLNNINIKFFILLKASFICVFFTFFFIQSLELTQQFLKHEVGVTFYLEKPYLIEVPAVTVCYHKIIAYDKLCEYYPGLKETVNSIMEFVRKRNSTTENDASWKQDRKLTGKFRIPPEYLETILAGRMMQTLSAREIFNYTIDIRKRLNIKGLFDGQKFINHQNPLDFVGFIESIWGMKKCTTFTNQFNGTRFVDVDSLTQMKSSGEIYLKLYTSWDAWYSKLSIELDQTMKEIEVALHSPHVAPIASNLNFILLKTGKSWGLSYSRIESHLLEPPYKTNCKKYTTEKMSRSDCIEDCFKMSIKQFCGNESIPNERIIFKYSVPPGSCLLKL